MGKKRKIFILSAMAAGIAIFFGRKRMKAKSEETAAGDWTPDEDTASDAASDTVSDDASDAAAENSAESDSAEEAEEAAETTG